MSQGPRGEEGRSQGDVDSLLSSVAQAGTRPAAHFCTGHLDDRPPPRGLGCSLSCSPRGGLGHQVHLASKSVSWPGEDPQGRPSPGPPVPPAASLPLRAILPALLQSHIPKSQSSPSESCAQGAGQKGSPGTGPFRRSPCRWQALQPAHVGTEARTWPALSTRHAPGPARNARTAPKAVPAGAAAPSLRPGTRVRGQQPAGPWAPPGHGGLRPSIAHHASEGGPADVSGQKNLQIRAVPLK